MRVRTASLLVLAWLLLLQPSAVAHSAEEWQAIVEGIDYRHFWLPGPNQAYVARMDRTAEDLVVDSMLGQGRLYDGTETVSGMAKRYDGAVFPLGGDWQHTGQVVVAINGIFYDPETGVPETGMIQSGWYIKRFDEFGSGGFAWKSNGSAFIGGCVYHDQEKQIVSFLDRGQQMQIRGINVEQRSVGIVIYTPQFDSQTHTGTRGVEVVVELTRPAGITPSSSMAIGYIRNIRQKLGSTFIPFDHIVISARGEAGRQLLERAQVGERVGISQELAHLASDCRSAHDWNWFQTFSSIGGSFHFLNGGEIDAYEDNLGAVQRHPRTMVCFNDDFLYFIVVDGRQSGYSVGMTAAEMGRFCSQTLEAEWGINQDGGGSSTMWVDGKVVNRPSDGEERLVANGLMMVAMEPIDRSIEYASGQAVRTGVSANVRLGPGENYHAIGSVSAEAQGLILPHLNGLNGARVGGVNWWRVAFDGIQGWMREDALEAQGGLAVRLRILREMLKNISLDP